MEERRERSLALADERGMGMGVVHFVEAETHPWSGELARLVVAVESASQAETRYQVIYDPEVDGAYCTCRVAANLAPCWHAGVTVRYGRHAADAYSPAACSATEREQYLAWLDEG